MLQTHKSEIANINSSVAASNPLLTINFKSSNEFNVLIKNIEPVTYLFRDIGGFLFACIAIGSMIIYPWSNLNVSMDLVNSYFNLTKLVDKDEDIAYLEDDYDLDIIKDRLCNWKNTISRKILIFHKIAKREKLVKSAIQNQPDGCVNFYTINRNFSRFDITGSYIFQTQKSISDNDYKNFGRGITNTFTENWQKNYTMGSN